mmetsp:Transcript_62382/g.138932  ORF Transcript_62382/g.138932 Transcript_62382/m.138932 type:complete len:82 (-) Transcript_62382:417-662(-)
MAAFTWGVTSTKPTSLVAWSRTWSGLGAHDGWAVAQEIRRRLSVPLGGPLLMQWAEGLSWCVRSRDHVEDLPTHLRSTLEA